MEVYGNNLEKQGNCFSTGKIMAKMLLNKIIMKLWEFPDNSTYIYVIYITKLINPSLMPKCT